MNYGNAFKLNLRLRIRIQMGEDVTSRHKAVVSGFRDSVHRQFDTALATLDEKAGTLSENSTPKDLADAKRDYVGLVVTGLVFDVDPDKLDRAQRSLVDRTFSATMGIATRLIRERRVTELGELNDGSLEALVSNLASEPRANPAVDEKHVAKGKRTKEAKTTTGLEYIPQGRLTKDYSGFTAIQMGEAYGYENRENVHAPIMGLKAKYGAKCVPKMNAGEDRVATYDFRKVASRLIRRRNSKSGVCLYTREDTLYLFEVVLKYAGVDGKFFRSDASGILAMYDKLFLNDTNKRQGKKFRYNGFDLNKKFDAAAEEYYKHLKK